MTTVASAQRQSQTAAQGAPSNLQLHYQAAQSAQAAHDPNKAGYEFRVFLTDALGELALAHTAAGLYRDAAVEFEQALVFAPHSTVLQLPYARAALHAGDIENAASLAEQVTREEPRNATAHRIYGEALLKQDRNTDARQQFEQAVALDPDFVSGYDLAVACLNAGDEACASATFAEMRTAFGNEAGDRHGASTAAALHLYFGQAYLNSDFQNHAVTEFKAAIAANPRQPGAHYSLAAAYLVTGGGVDAAEAELRREIDIMPREAVAYAALGHLEAGQHKDADAMRDLERAVALDPTDPDSFLYLGQLQSSQGKTADAIASLRTTIHLTTDVTRNNTQVQRAHYLLGRLLMQSGDTTAGQSELKISESLMGRNLAQARERLADYYQEPTAPGAPSGTTPGAYPDADPGAASRTTPGQNRATSTGGAGAANAAQALAAQLTPAIADSYNNLGALAGSAGQYREALGYFERAQEWSPELPGLQENLGRAAYAAGQFAQAVPPLTQYLAAHPEDAVLRAALGISLSMTGDYSSAVRVLQPVAASPATSVQARFLYAEAMRRTGHAAASAEALTALATQMPQSPEIHRALGEALADEQQYPRAIGELTRAIALNPRDARAQLALGRVRLASGDAADAITSLQAAVALDAGNREAHTALASAYRAAGRDGDAARETRLAAQRDADTH